MKNDLTYLGHMYDTACKAVGKLEGRTRADFDEDDNLQLALVHLIQTLGESARRVSDQTKGKHPQIPFRQIVGMRHKVVHDYMDVDLDVVFSVVIEDLPSLIAELEKIVPMEG
jgi:uncharacterized protein with HEPN domain